jgi:hypothetical protein
MKLMSIVVTVFNKERESRRVSGIVLPGPKTDFADRPEGKSDDA